MPFGYRLKSLFSRKRDSNPEIILQSSSPHSGSPPNSSPPARGSLSVRGSSPARSSSPVRGSSARGSSPARGVLGVQVLWDPATEAQGVTEADIIAVHGLAGDSIRTWTHLETGKIWLKDFLPEKIPNARIMSYGYRSDPRSRNVLGIMENAEGLLEGLKAKRNGVENRPLIFVGHSLGGLVIKKALLKARDQRNELLEATFGIMFMGVPHNGSEVASFTRHLKAIVNIAVPLSMVNLDELNRDSRALADLSDQFGSIQDRFFYVSVFESEQTALLHPMIRGSAMVVPSASARLNLGNREIKFSISGADHQHVCKFAKADDQFEPIWANLSRMIKDALAKSLLEPRPSSGLIPAPSERKRHLMLPFSRHKNLVGRSEILRQLDAKLPSDNHRHQRAALWGLGGIGKTQIALEFAYRIWEKSQKSIFWVHASNAERFDQGYRDIAKRINIPGHDDPKIDIKTSVRDWFQSDETGDWVLIFDNADDFETFFGSQNQPDRAIANDQIDKLFQYIPNGPTGTLLFTTRDLRVARRLTGGGGCEIKVEKLENTEGTQIFKHEVQDDLYVEGDALKLLEALEYFPLAITQAAAYIRENGKTLSEYLDLYRESEEAQRILLSEEFGDLRRDRTVTNSVMTTWHISFEQIRRQSTLAENLLYIMSMLDRQGIPRSLITKAESNATTIDIDKALGSLVAFSFITPSKDRNGYEMHKLVQLAIQTKLDHDRSMEYAAKALTLISKNFPLGSKHENRQICQIYTPHVTTILARESTEESTLDLSLLLHNYAMYRWTLGNYKEAETMAQRALDGYQRVLGLEHPSTLDSLNNLALVLQRQGKYEEAEEMNRRALDAQERVLGLEHPSTLVSLNNLALVLQYQGKYEEAEEMNRRALDAKERVLGLEHPSTLDSLDNLATVLQGQGKYEEAEEMNRRALDAKERVLGLEHPSTLDSLDNLATVLQGQGKYEEAEEMNRRALDAKERVLGLEHPSTLVSLDNLATVLQYQGKYEEAEEMNRRALDAQERVLGLEHPSTLDSLNNLALVLQYQGKYEEAEEMNRRALDGYKRVLGPEHPDTLISLRNLVVLLKTLEKYEEAEKVNQSATGSK